MQPLEAGSFDVSGVFFSLSAAVLAKRKPYEGPQYPTRNTSASLSKPAPAPLHITPASTPAPTPTSLSAAEPDYTAPGFQESLWLKKGSRTRQEAAGATNAPKPGLSLAALEKLRS